MRVHSANIVDLLLVGGCAAPDLVLGVPPIQHSHLSIPTAVENSKLVNCSQGPAFLVDSDVLGLSIVSEVHETDVFLIDQPKDVIVESCCFEDGSFAEDGLTYLLFAVQVVICEVLVVGIDDSLPLIQRDG